MSSSIIDAIDNRDLAQERLTQVSAILDTICVAGAQGDGFELPHKTVMGSLWAAQALLEQADGALKKVSVVE